MYVALTREQIIDLHDELLNLYGGMPGEKEPGLIDSLVVKPFTTYFGEEQYPGLFLKAAVYLHGFATAQYFNDGNKRTGVYCALVFLDLNGYELTASWEELYDVALMVANKQMGLDELAIWLESNSVERRENENE
jgi:death-on-curing protein